MDAISNMIIQVKNAGLSGHDHVAISYSNQRFAIARVLKQEGFIKDASRTTTKGKKFINLDLFIENRVPKINGVKRISKPSKRIYKKSNEIRSVKNGYGA